MCIWSDGPKVEDAPTQEIKYATSQDGLIWTAAKSVTGTPEAPYAYIARGLWVRDGELLALGAHYKGKGAFGSDKELQLQAFVWDAGTGQWKFKGKVFDDAINNFAPQVLPSGEWIVTRRDSRFNVTMMIGGRLALDHRGPTQWSGLARSGIPSRRTDLLVAPGPDAVCAVPGQRRVFAPFPFDLDRPGAHLGRSGADQFSQRHQQTVFARKPAAVFGCWC